MLSGDVPPSATDVKELYDTFHAHDRFQRALLILQRWFRGYQVGDIEEMQGRYRGDIARAPHPAALVPWLPGAHRSECRALTLALTPPYAHAHAHAHATPNVVTRRATTRKQIRCAGSSG